jgi:hypothetical protein
MCKVLSQKKSCETIFAEEDAKQATFLFLFASHNQAYACKLLHDVIGWQCIFIFSLASLRSSGA